jgi:hypothetical protein
MRLLNHALILVPAAVVAMTFCGAASAQVPDGQWEIIDKNEAGTTAILDFEEVEFGVNVEAVCVPFADDRSTTGSAVRAVTDHPDRVTGKKGSAEVEQGEKTNFGIIRLVTGSNPSNSTEISCKKLSIEGNVKTKRAPTGKFRVKASDCDCPLNVEGTCDDFMEQVRVLQTDCSTHKSIKFDYSEKKEIVKKITISGKGDATPLE